MSRTDDAHAWWSRLRHQGLLLSPVVMIERYPSAPPPARFPLPDRLRDARTRFVSSVEGEKGRTQAAALAFVDALLENFVGHGSDRLAKQHSIPESYTTAVRIGSRSQTVKPHRVLFADDGRASPVLLVMADESAHVGRGKGRTKYAELLELLRATGHRLGLLTNGDQFRLVYAGLDFESWCEWEADRWFDDGEGTEELLGLRQLLAPEQEPNVTAGAAGLLHAVEESRKRQADLSSVLRENVRQAVELLLEEVSTSNRQNPDLFGPLVRHGERTLSDAEAHEALMQATVRLVMRLVVCLFAESRQLLPTNDPIYAQSYGVRTLYELLDSVKVEEGGVESLFNRRAAWPRLMALFRLIHGGSAHGSFPLRSYGGALFRPGDAASDDAVARALHLLEHEVEVGDATIYHVLRKLLRGPLPVLRGRSRTFVEGPVDYTDLRTEFIGLIYEGLLDYRLKRTDEATGPQVFLNIGREPVLPLARLEDMLANDKPGLKNLLTTLRKEKVTASAGDDAESGDEEAEEAEQTDEEAAEEPAAEEPAAEVESVGDDLPHAGEHLSAFEAARGWAKEAVTLAGLVGRQNRRETDAEYEGRIEAEANRLIKRVVSHGEFYLVRAGNTRKGTGTFYTRPQLAVPTTHRTLRPLCYDTAEDGTPVPKTPEEILGLKVCDPACGSASFLVAALHYLTDALYRSLCHHRKLDNPATAKKVTLPFGRRRTDTEADQLVPFPPDDPQRGHTFEDRVKALLRRHVVERSIYGVDINPLAVELARVSLWVETLDPELPFSFLDHKIKVGNALVGCWLDRVEDYPLKAWEREGGDGKTGPRTQRIEEFLKGERVGNRRTGDGRIKVEMRKVIEDRRFANVLFPEGTATADEVVSQARAEYERLHDLPVSDPDERERHYRARIEHGPAVRTLRRAMDEWCAVWFWPTDEESLRHAPTPISFHAESPSRSEIVGRLTGDFRFFHWELEFPDVFTPDRAGFDGMIGNPPWDVVKPSSQEFFTEFDPLFRTLDKQAALRRQTELCGGVPGVAAQWDDYNARFKALGNWAKNAAAPFDLSLARGNEGSRLAAVWAKRRFERSGHADPRHPFRLQGSADFNLYKLFAESFWSLLRSDGRLGVILPTGIYSDLGTRALREEFLDRGRIDLLYAFQNEKRVFAAAHHSFKQVMFTATKGGQTISFLTRFRMGVGDSPEAHDLPEDILRRDQAAMTVTPEEIRSQSPAAMSVVELGGQRDQRVFRKIYDNAIRVGDEVAGWEVTYAREFDMSNDSKRFPPVEKWEARGYRPDVFGRWIGPNGEVALPFYQGISINQFDPSYKGWKSGLGRSSAWRRIPYDSKVFQPKFLISRDTLLENERCYLGPKVVHRQVARSTDSRSMISCVIVGFGCGYKLPAISSPSKGLPRPLFMSAVFNSFAFDFATRIRNASTDIAWNVLADLPIPSRGWDSERLVLNAARLSLIHRRFAPEWLRLRSKFSSVSEYEWKLWWATTESDRLRLRVESDALCADLYDLDPDDFDWILRDDPCDSKGFYRVERHLPFQERLTGLAAAGFRALKAGRWSAESAVALSNDEFFETLGIPELTSAAAAKAKGLSGPLIAKRDGCHVWNPESFPEDDPRHGWTWEHCWNDAIALLGSEEALREYVEGPKESAAEPDGEFEEPFRLKRERATPPQKRLFDPHRTDG